MKKKKLRLKELSQEAFALVDFLVQESIARGQGMSYRLSIPYSSLRAEKADGDIIIDISVYFDKVMVHGSEESERVFKITGPDKGRH